jgi:hypothetical protein
MVVSMTAPLVASNPFATRYVKPGAVEFDFAGEGSHGDLIAKLAAQQWRGAIVGPHGSGKSTLLTGLLSRLPAVGRVSLLYQLHDGQRSLSPPPDPAILRAAETIIVVDGFEQLSLWNRWRLPRLCRQYGLGLVITSHRATRLPLLFHTKPTLELATSLAAGLLGQELSPAWRDKIELSFARRRGDLRELVFDLYDFYELQRRNS